MFIAVSVHVRLFEFAIRIEFTKLVVSKEELSNYDLLNIFVFNDLNFEM